MELSQEQAAQVQSKLQQHEISKCNACGIGSMVVNSKIVQLPVNPATNEIMPCLVLICDTCHRVMLVNGILSGILSPSNKSTNDQVVQVSLNPGEHIKMALEEVRLIENRAGIMMTVVAALIALVLTVSYDGLPVSALTFVLISCLVFAISSFLCYFSAFRGTPQFRMNIQELPSLVDPGMMSPDMFTASMKWIEAVEKKKVRYSKMGHGLFIGALLSLVISQLLLKFAPEALKHNADIVNYLLSVVLFLISGVVALLVYLGFKSWSMTDTIVIQKSNQNIQ